MRRTYVRKSVIAFVLAAAVLYSAPTWTPMPVADDPLVRMPGTQPGDGVSLDAPRRCLNCHESTDPPVAIGFEWKGSMMAQAARDFLFFACMTVAGQDSIWAIGRPSAIDLCERCHFTKGWLEGRSDPPNASLMTGADYDGVHCDVCHRMYDPFFKTTYEGSREGNDWLNYWDETNASGTPSQAAADATRAADSTEAQTVSLFSGGAFFDANEVPISPTYAENGSGQFFISANDNKRASFADANPASHDLFYSRYHKSKYMCGTCHDVSNPALANIAFLDPNDYDPNVPLPTEQVSASSYFHVERTFSEFMLSAYGQQGGAAGIGPFAPGTFITSDPNNLITKCQDCHMRDIEGVGCNKNALTRPTESVEHPKSGMPMHDLTGGNAWVSYVLASAISGSPNYDAVNEGLLDQGPAALTLDLSQGEGIDPVALLDGVERAKYQLDLAASIEDAVYNANTGGLSFRVQNQTGHKLISGFPEGRRMFVNIKAYASGELIHEVNPYDYTIGTLKGLPSDYSQNSPPLSASEVYADELVYEAHPSSALTGESQTFHFALATGRDKDNRIPPKGFRIAEAPDRLSEPVWHGVSSPDYYTAEEYAGGYDAVSLAIAPDADQVVVRLYYQTTSREYVEFLRDEINGTGANLTLPGSAYIVQIDPFFDQLKAWGDTIWQLWDHNKDVAGAAPYLMTQANASITIEYTLDLSIKNASYGTVDVDPNQATYAPGTEVTLTATPNEDGDFREWRIFDPEHPDDVNYALIDTNNPTTIVMESDKAIQAVFKCSGNSSGELLPPILVVLMTLSLTVVIRRVS